MKNKRLTTILIVIIVVSASFATLMMRKMIFAKQNQQYQKIDATVCPPLPISETYRHEHMKEEVTGAQVISYINKAAKDNSNISIMVTNQNTNAFYCYCSGKETSETVSVTCATDPNSIYYINSNDEYYCLDIIDETVEIYLGAIFVRKDTYFGFDDSN